ncbi:pilus assembly FimT family protein [Bacillus sp. NTK034]|nr:prepilin-type N-terminal cleavage/methylation domain-containing protein [Bacillus sp. NTK034]MBN8200716.1 prepilin-type N-terminal cleavage/methylation domain-containing protein [Bacillus sp. NTK034]
MMFAARLKQKGFTLIEVLAVLIILGIISLIAIIAVNNVIQRVKDQAFVGNAFALKESAELYIKNEMISGSALPEKVTYKRLAEADFIEPIRDPDTKKLLQPSEYTFAVVKGKSITAVCFKGEKRSLCYSDGNEGIPIYKLDPDLITEN